MKMGAQMANETITLNAAEIETVEIVTGSGRVEVIATDGGRIAVDGVEPERRPDRPTPAHDRGRLTIHPERRSANITVRCPAGIDIVAATRSGRISVSGPFGRVRVSTRSGSISVDRAEHVDARSHSGKIAVSECRGRARLDSVSGAIEVRDAGEVRLNIVSGSAKLYDVRASCKAHAVNGSVELHTQGEGDVEISTISGSVRVRLPAATRPRVKARSVSGRVSVELPEGDDLRIDAYTVSGRIAVGPA